MDALRIFNLQLFAEDDFEDNQIDSDVVADETVDDVDNTFLSSGLLESLGVRLV